MGNTNIADLFKRLNWTINVVCIVLCMTLSLKRTNIEYIGLFSMLLFVILNFIYFKEEKARIVLKVIYILLSFVFLFINPIPVNVILPVVACLMISFNKVSKLVASTVAVGCIEAIYFIYRIDKDFVNSFIICSVVLGTVIIVAVIYYVEQKYITLSENMNNAMKKLAIEAMKEKNLREQIARERDLEVENIKLSERDRISRDIHNQVGHTLSAATVTLDAAEVLMDAGDEKSIMLAKEKISKANERIHEAISSVRSVVRTMDADDDKIFIKDYIESIEELIKNFKMDTNINIISNFEQIKDNEGKITIENAAFLSGAIAELLTNGIKHGGANIFVIVMVAMDNMLKLKVQDNGKGMSDSGNAQFMLDQGFGLKKIKDYLLKHGGNMSISGDDGFEVEMEITAVVS